MSLAVGPNLQAVHLEKLCALWQNWVLLYKCKLIDQRASPNMVVSQNVSGFRNKREGTTLGHDSPPGAKSGFLFSNVIFGYNPAASGY